MSLSADYKTFEASLFGAGGAGLQIGPPALFFSLPFVAAWAFVGPWTALAVAIAAALPRLLWQPSRSAEGQIFFIANALYWNLVYPAFFGSPLLIGALCFWRPLYCLPPFFAWLLYTRLASRPDLNVGQPWAHFAKHDWGIVALRFWLRLRLHVSRGLREREPAKPVVIAIHPHGVASDYRVAMDGLLYEALPGREVLTLAASVLFALPLVRELVLWTRCIDAGKRTASKALSKGCSLAVIPGGEAEQMRTQTGVEEVYLTKRAGFVKLAMQQRAALVPCYAFGTVDLYTITPSQHATNSKGLLWKLSKQYGVAMPLYRGALGFVPKRQRTDLVFGAPFEPACATPGEPTDAEVAAAHANYIAALKALFDEHKGALGYGDRELIVA